MLQAMEFPYDAQFQDPPKNITYPLAVIVFSCNDYSSPVEVSGLPRNDHIERDANISNIGLVPLEILRGSVPNPYAVEMLTMLLA